MHIQTVKGYLQRFRGRRIAVVGDLMLDRYIWGRASRISQEAPVPVVTVERTSSAPGGAANVLRNLAALGAEPIPFGIVGRDEAGEALCALLREWSTDHEGLVAHDAAVTTVKTRVIAGSQQVVRIDTEACHSVMPEARDAMLRALIERIQDRAVEAVIVEDYAKGVVTGELLQDVVGAGRTHAVPVMMDPHPANRHHVKGLTLLTPNRAEAFALAGAYFVDGHVEPARDAALVEVVRRLEEDLEPDYLLVTLGALGMALFQKGELVIHVPTKAREVFDVSGAGDTVIAVYTLGCLAGAPAVDAAVLANHAAGVVVGKVGTAPVYPEELLRSFGDHA